MSNIHIGLDIGGQTIRCIALDAKLNRVSEASIVTPAREGSLAVLAAIRSVIDMAAEEGTIISVGAGTPGGVDSQGVIVGMAANIAGWFGTHLGEYISSAAGGVPAVVRNDGNMAAFGEWVARKGSSRALVYIGLGTGIGGGYIEGGRILGGCDDRALEIGHFAIEPGGRSCVCGAQGCAEAYGSGPSIGRIAMDLALGKDPALGSLDKTGTLQNPGLDKNFNNSQLAAAIRSGLHANAKDVYEAYAKGDALALFVDFLATEALSRMTATALAVLAPDLVVLGGGVIRGATHLPSSIKKRMPSLVYEDAWRHCGFEQSLLSHEAGLYGAAWYGAALVASSQDVIESASKWGKSLV
jgi:glucokinase